MSDVGKPIKQKKPVLADHKRVGKRLIPPILQLQDVPFEGISWVDCTLPELIWLGLLIQSEGVDRGTALASALATTADRVVGETRKKWYAATSAYSFLSEEHKNEVLATLHPMGYLNALKTVLSPLVVLYPECPLAFLFQGHSPALESPEQPLESFKGFLESHFNKRGRPATLAQATAVYIAGITGKMVVVEGVKAFDNFSAIVDYPDTDVSKRVAASIYASVNGFMGFFLDEYSYSQYTPWSRYFWNRGLELEPCTVQGVYEAYEQ